MEDKRQGSSEEAVAVIPARELLRPVLPAEEVERSREVADGLLMGWAWGVGEQGNEQYLVGGSPQTLRSLLLVSFWGHPWHWLGSIVSCGQIPKLDILPLFPSGQVSLAKSTPAR